MVLAPNEFAAVGSGALPALERREGFGRKLRRHPLALSGMIIVGVLLFVALFAGVISHTDPSVTQPHGLSPMGEPHGPGEGFLLGADRLGRDVWVRTLYGARISLTVGLCAMLTATLIGSTVGLVGGYFGGWVDVLLTRFTETVMSLPTILLAITLYEVLPGDSSTARFLKLLLAISLVTWTGIARAVRGQVLSLKEQEFIESARAIGCSHLRIIAYHLLPNVLPTVIILATLATAQNILLEAGLSYLGLGADPSWPSWGGMIQEGQQYILSAPWILFFPSTAVALAVVGFNLLGQALQETLEPRAL